MESKEKREDNILKGEYEARHKREREREGRRKQRTTGSVVNEPRMDGEWKTGKKTGAFKRQSQPRTTDSGGQ